MTNPSPITVHDNHGSAYTARILQPGDAYGNGAIWGDASYHDEGRLGITIDGTPSTFYADGFVGKAEGHRVGAALAIDLGANWFLTEESTLRFYQLADSAFDDTTERLASAEVATSCDVGSDGTLLLLTLNGKDYSLTAGQAEALLDTLGGFVTA